jgi:coenzyme F420 hydrogenase subunit beta
MQINSLEEVVNSRICVGCGACAYVSGGSIRMREIADQGWRPSPVSPAGGAIPGDCLAVCPAASSRVETPEPAVFSQAAYAAGLGPVMAMWEVHATNREVRHQAASGGALTALAAYALEQEAMAGVLHIAQDPADPFKNITVLSGNREELLGRAGSRYAPASLCERLDLVDAAPGTCAVIGQPSEIAALRKIMAIRPSLCEKIGITLSFFCAGSPSMQGTMDLIRSRGIDTGEVTKIRYRGRGWPGNFAVWVKGGEQPVLEMTYAESWAYLQSHRPWGVHIWPDGAGEHADISCGDPWYRQVVPGEEGSSLVMARTARGVRFVTAALEAGYLKGSPVEWEKVAKSQQNLLNKKGSVAGRLFAMRALGMPTPDHRGYRLGSLWRALSMADKARSLFGTARRILKRGYRKPANWWAGHAGHAGLPDHGKNQIPPASRADSIP